MVNVPESAMHIGVGAGNGVAVNKCTGVGGVREDLLENLNVVGGVVLPMLPDAL